MSNRDNHRILIIDDNPEIHRDFAKILTPEGREQEAGLDEIAGAFFEEEGVKATRAGFTLDSAQQGHEGLRKVQMAVAEGNPYAVAFVDVRMPPGWDGFQTSLKLWEVDPDLQIIICTAYSDYAWDDVFCKVGKPDSMVVLKKPFDNIEVIQLAHALAEKKHLLQQVRHLLHQLGRSEAMESRALRDS